jgi:tetratricopeptide (TPR) repeat protein
MEISEILAALEKLAQKIRLNTEDVWLVQRLLEELYPQAQGIEIFRRAAEVVVKLDSLADISGVNLVTRTRAEYSGLFMAYHSLLKSLPRDASGAVVAKQISAQLAEKIKILEIMSDRGFYQLDKHDTPRLWIQYGLLLSLIKSQLQSDAESAKKIDEKVKPVALELGEELYLLKEINARGLAELKLRNYKTAIRIFEEAAEKFSGAADIPYCRQEFANILNNQAKARIDYCEVVSNSDIKVDLLRDAVFGLNRALQFYKAVPPVPPVNHVEGVRNRLIIAGFRWLQLGSDEVRPKGKAAEVCFKQKQIDDAIGYLKEAYGMEENLEIQWILKYIREAQEVIAANKETN